MHRTIDILQPNTGEIVGRLQIPRCVKGDPQSAWVIQQVVECIVGYNTSVSLIELQNMMIYLENRLEMKKLPEWQLIMDDLYSFMDALESNINCHVIFSELDDDLVC